MKTSVAHCSNRFIGSRVLCVEPLLKHVFHAVLDLPMTLDLALAPLPSVRTERPDRHIHIQLISAT